MPSGVLQIQSDSDDRRIFFNLKFAIMGLLWGEDNFSKYFFGEGSILGGEIWMASFMIKLVIR